MAEDKTKEQEEKAEGEAPAEGEAKPKKSKKKLIIIAIPLVLALVGAGLFFGGVIGGKKEEKKEVSTEEIQKTSFLDLEEFLVNLNNPGGQVSFLKASIVLELPNQTSVNEVQNNMPRIRDAFQIYLRELRTTDLQGSAGLQRLKTELLIRVNALMDKGKVNNILFKEIVVQ